MKLGEERSNNADASLAAEQAVAVVVDVTVPLINPATGLPNADPAAAADAAAAAAQGGSGASGLTATPVANRTTAPAAPATEAPTTTPDTATPTTAPAALPAAPSATQPEPTQPATTQPKTTQPPTTQPKTTQPKTTQPPTTQAPTTTQAPEVVATEYLYYSFSGVASTIIVANHGGSSLQFWSASTEPGWVYNVEKATGSEITVKFFKPENGDEGQFTAKLEGGNVKIEKES